MKNDDTNRNKSHSLIDDNYVYIDLFDDDLYSPEEFYSHEPQNLDLLNTIRLQILLAILFDKRIAVPEQWALSSLTFLSVFEEVTDQYQRDISYEEDGSAQKKWTVPPPILITFRNRAYGKTSPLALAMSDRILSQRRLRIDPFLARPQLDEAKQIHFKLNRMLSSYISGEAKGKLYSTDFQDDFAIALGGSQASFDTARKLSKLGSFIDSNKQTAIRFHDPTTYDRDLGYYTQNVKHVCFEPKFAAVFKDDRIAQFREFWRRSEEAGYGAADISKMWTVTDDMDADSHLLITKMGRYCMHRALSRASQASYGSNFYGAYSGEDDDFDVNIINRMRELETDNLVEPDLAEDFEFLAAKNTSDYEPIENLPWKSIWRDVSIFSRTTAWKKTRAEIKSRFENASSDDVATDQFWLAVFDEINSSVRTFTFEKSHLGEGKFNVAMNLGRDIVGTRNKDKSSLIKLIGTLAMLANMAGASPQKLYQFDMKVTREFRKAAKFKNSLRK